MASVFNGIEFSSKEPSLIPFNEFLLPFRQSMKDFLGYCASANQRLCRPKLKITTNEFCGDNLAEQYVSLKTPMSPSKFDLTSPTLASPNQSISELAEPGQKSKIMSLRKKHTVGNRSVLSLFKDSNSELAMDETNKSTNQLDSPIEEGPSTVKLLKKKTMSIKNIFSHEKESSRHQQNESMSQLSVESEDFSIKKRNPSKSIKNFFQPKYSTDAEFVEFVEELRKVEGVIRLHFKEFGTKLGDGEKRAEYWTKFEEWWTLVKEYEI